MKKQNKHLFENLMHKNYFLYDSFLNNVKYDYYDVHLDNGLI